MSLCMQRKSVRRFLPAKVSDETIEKLLMSAMQAPTAVNQQPWAFVVIKNKAILAQLSQVSKGAWPLKEAPLAILTLLKKDCKNPVMAPQDMSAATQNILLEATHQNLGGVWIGVHPRKERIENIQNMLELPENHEPFSLIALGYPGEDHRKISIRYDKSRIKVLD